MLLKSLEIQGFKSFPDRTKIQFGKGLTAVVGPNGSGKSNISDAVRWVMGEQSTRNLRGTKMEDVIFTGTKSRKSQGFAEVSLTIDNTDRALPVEDDEVIITRKYYRSGESEYRINRKEVRLKDINEMLMDTGLGRDGYAMVGQGRIAEIVQSRSDQRREIFEEAAGISKYRYRKNEAEKKLVSAEENLLRLQDILTELEERVGPLKEQSEKAKQFLDLSEQKKQMEISSWLYTLEQQNQNLKDQNDRILARQLEHDQIRQQEDTAEKEIQSLYERMQQCLVEIDELRRQKEETTEQVSSLQAAVAVCRNDLAHNRENQERTNSQISEFMEHQDAFGKLALQKQEQLDDLQEQIEQLDEEMVAQESALQQLAQRTEQSNQKITVLTREINELLMRQSQNKLTVMQLTSQQQEEQQRFSNNQETLKLKEEEIHLNKGELQQVKELMEHLSQRQEEIQNSLKGYEMKLSRKEEQFNSLGIQYNQLDLERKEKLQRAKMLHDLEQNLEGFAYSVKTVLKQASHGILSGICGTVAQLLEVPEEYSLAIETALGGSLQNLVVENENHAKSAIRFLQRENAGRATFLPMTAVKGTRMSTQTFSQEEGYVALASELVTFEQRYTGVIDFLLGRTVVAEDLDSAVQIAKKNQYKFRIVTLDGQVVNAGGSMAGGSRGKAPGFLSRRADIVKLEQQAQQLAAEMQNIKESSRQLKEELTTLRGSTYGLNSEQTTIREDKIRCEGEEKRLSQLIVQQDAEFKEMKREMSEYEERLQNQLSRGEQLRSERDTIDACLEEKRADLADCQSQAEQLEKQRSELSQSCSEIRYRRLEVQKDVQVLQNDLESLRQRGNDALAQVNFLKEQLEQLKQRESRFNDQIEYHIQEIRRQQDGSSGMEQRVQETMHLRNTLESQASQMRQKTREISSHRERLAQELARAEERRQAVQKEYDSIIAKLWEEYQLTRSEAQQFAVEVEDIQQLNRTLSSVKAKIKGLGSVNVSAIEEYQEVSERYRFLDEQVQDVRKSKAELVRLIEQLTQQMKEIFAENFAAINQNFRQIFVELFGGGRAELRMTDPEDLLGSGIEIFVEPPGKIIKNLSLLSGGEQAFVAIAIYFAILKVRPAPFCILDEIEAALDDVNVGKYARYLRLISGKTQFIMITHRRGTMEEADMLYGVTMQEEGVSKLLPLNIGEIERELGEAVS